jgi:hypothetical protein
LTGPIDGLAEVRAILSLLSRDVPLDKHADARTLPQPALLLFTGAAGLLDRIDGDRPIEGFWKDEDFEAKHPRNPAGSEDGKPGAFRSTRNPAPNAGSREDAERRGIGGNSGNKAPLKPEPEDTPKPRRTQAEKLAEEAKSRELYKRITQLRALLGAIVGSPEVGLFFRAALEQLVTWLKSAKIDDLPTLRAALDEPKSYDELCVDKDYHEFKSMKEFKEYYGPAPAGYEYHHIVEQGGANASLPPEKLHNTDNVILVPKLKHEEISARYSREDTVYGTYRRYVQTLTYDEQLAIGADELREVEVLK